MQTKEKSVKLKWYKWMIYFMLFASAALNIIYGVLYAAGVWYYVSGVPARLVYMVFPSLQVMDIYLGVMMLCMAILMIVTRFRLAKFKRNAPEFVYSLYFSNIFSTLVYGIVSSCIIGKIVFGISEIVYLIGQAVMTVLNYCYFKKRSHLFVN